MIELENKTNLKIDILPLEHIANLLTTKEIELIITTDDDMREINKTHRGIDKSTDVLSFPYEDMPMSPLGSIVISTKHVHDVSIKLNHSFDDELALLFIHGLLHLLGYDHEVDNGEMRLAEKELIQKFKLPKSLLIRIEE